MTINISNKVGLIILDGRGLAEDASRSAIAQAHTPNFDRLWQQYPHTTLTTFGEQVGLPEGQMGNSEVGHMNIGAGRVVYQDLVKINKAIREQQLEHNLVLQAALTQAKLDNKPIHLVGLVSDGGVHSHIDHMEYLIDIFYKHNVPTIIHAITDGRDVGPQTGINFISRLYEYCQSRNSHIKSIVGRYYAMDRDNRWDRVAKAYDLMVKGVGQVFTDPIEAMQASYNNEVYDEFVEPIYIVQAGFNADVQSVIGDYNVFLDSICTHVESYGIDISEMYIDHLSYKTPTDEQYVTQKDLMNTIASMIHETMISGRLISIWKLDQPIIYNGYGISIIELSAPKRDTDGFSGLDHLEFLTKIDLTELQAKYSSINRELKGLERKGNQDIALRFDDGSRVKFHNQSLEQVVYKEGAIKPKVPINDLIADGSIVLITNFRTDRGRELVSALSQQDYPEQNMKALDLTMITMTNYDDTFHDVQVIAPRQNLSMTLGETISLAGKTQLRIAETEKYPHVTFFFSGGRELPFEGESRIVIPSPQVATYDLQPSMSAHDVTQSAINHIQEHMPDFLALNWANTDMVGHTGMMSAAIQATQVVDDCLGDLVNSTLPLGYTWIIIADHGNADMMTNLDGSPHTAHTLSPVPCIIASQVPMEVTLSEGKLADIAPTILTLIGIDIPEEMDGDSLVQ